MKMLIKVIGALISFAASIFICNGAVKIGDDLAEKHAPEPDENGDIAAAGGAPEPEAPAADEVDPAEEEGS